MIQIRFDFNWIDDGIQALHTVWPGTTVYSERSTPHAALAKIYFGHKCYDVRSVCGSCHSWKYRMCSYVHIVIITSAKLCFLRRKKFKSSTRGLTSARGVCVCKMGRAVGHQKDRHSHGRFPVRKSRHWLIVRLTYAYIGSVISVFCCVTKLVHFVLLVKCFIENVQRL